MIEDKVFKDGDIKILDLQDLNSTTDTPDDAILLSKVQDIKDLIARVRELESDVIMWRSRAMEMMGKFCYHIGSNPNGIMDRWDHHERTVKGRGHE